MMEIDKLSLYAEVTMTNADLEKMEDFKVRGITMLKWKETQSC
jgi:hypothetical protein